jgi:hypothetical protein
MVRDGRTGLDGSVLGQQPIGTTQSRIANDIESISPQNLLALYNPWNIHPYPYKAWLMTITLTDHPGFVGQSLEILPNLTQWFLGFLYMWPIGGGDPEEIPKDGVFFRRAPSDCITL